MTSRLNFSSLTCAPSAGFATRGRRRRLQAGRSARLVGAGVFFATMLAAVAGFACDNTFPERFRSEKTVWCVYQPAWQDHQADIEAFFPFGDQVVDKLTALFNVAPSNLPFTIEVGESDGSAQTPSHFGPGVRVTGDAYWNEAFGVKGFWGYLLTLHEFINQWTGLVTGGWPTDWWADHRSPFPNSMDWHIFEALGHSDAARAQRDRFTSPSSGSYDKQVVMFDDIFARPDYGFDGFSRAFSYLQSDGMRWDALRDPPGYDQHTRFKSGNPSQLLNHYVIAYLSLGARADLTETFINADVGEKPSSWTEAWEDGVPDGVAVGDIADAHCSLAAAGPAIERAGDGSARSALDDARQALRRGDFAHAVAAVPGYPGACGADCPAQCGCNTTTDRCVAPWRASTPIGAGGGGDGVTTSVGVSSSAVGSTSVGVGSSGVGSSSAGGGEGGGDNGGPMTGSCSCRTLGTSGSEGELGPVVALAGVALFTARRRRTRRATPVKPLD